MLLSCNSTCLPLGHLVKAYLFLQLWYKRILADRIGQDAYVLYLYKNGSLIGLSDSATLTFLYLHEKEGHYGLGAGD